MSIHLKRILRGVHLIVGSLLFFVLLTDNPVRLNEHFKYHNNPSAVEVRFPPGNTAWDLLKDEHKKVVDEIKMRIEQEDAWFRYKFILAGGLLTAFLVNMVGLGGNQDRGTDSDHQLKRLIGSKATCMALAMACVVVTVIDIHIRSNIGVSNQLGLWIANYVEPASLQRPFDQSKLENFLLPYLPYEQYLRVPPYEQYQRVPPDGPGSGMHEDYVSHLIYWAHLHFLTFTIYVVCLGSFQTYYINLNRTTGNNQPNQSELQFLFFITFGFIHLSVLFLTLTIHYVPGAFEVKLGILDLVLPKAWCPGGFCSGQLSAVVYSIIAFVLVVVNGIFLFGFSGGLSRFLKKIVRVMGAVGVMRSD